MRRLAAVFFALSLLGLSGPAVARPHAAAGPGLAYRYSNGPNIADPVEQETDWAFPADQSLWVINPSHQVPCSWDVDDQWMSYAQGTLGAGESLAVDECVIASPTSFYRTVYGQTGWWSQQAGLLGQRLQAPSAGLTVAMCWQPQGRCFTPAPTYDAANKVYVWRSCARAQYHPTDLEMVEVPGSQGGIGMFQTVTVTVTNPTSHNVRNVFSDVSAVSVVQVAGSGFTSGCPDQNSGLYVTDYPFTYYVS